MLVKIIKDFTEVKSRPADTIFIFGGSDDQTSLILAEHDWANLHREKLITMKGYCDFAANRRDSKQAEIQVFVPPAKVLAAIKAMSN